MTDGLSIGWSNARQAGTLKTYKAILGFNLFLHLVVGLACIFIPNWVADVVGLPEPVQTGWTRSWGAMLILVTALYIPGLMDPVHKRAPNIIGILGRVWMGTIWVFCGGGFLWFALFDYVWAAIIAVFYVRLFRAVIMSRP